MTSFDYIERALALSDKMRERGRSGDADRLLSRAIDAFGLELASRDPVTADMLELDQALAAHAIDAARRAAELELVRVRRR